VSYQQAWDRPPQSSDLRVVAPLEAGKVKPLFPRIA
jgi:hypothetical protein